jgi:hypothetical protein
MLFDRIPSTFRDPTTLRSQGWHARSIRRLPRPNWKPPPGRRQTVDSSGLWSRWHTAGDQVRGPGRTGRPTWASRLGKHDRLPQPPDLAVVEMDGGRLQILDRRAAPRDPIEDEDDEPQERAGHWREDKIGVLMTMTSTVSRDDPGPEIPEHFVDPTRILKLARAIKGAARPRPPETNRRPPRSSNPGCGFEPRWRPEAMPSGSGRFSRRRRAPGASRQRGARRSSPTERRPTGRPTSNFREVFVVVTEPVADQVELKMIQQSARLVEQNYPHSLEFSQISKPVRKRHQI